MVSGDSTQGEGDSRCEEGVTGSGVIRAGLGVIGDGYEDGAMRGSALTLCVSSSDVLLFLRVLFSRCLCFFRLLVSVLCIWQTVLVDTYLVSSTLSLKDTDFFL